MPDLNLYRQEIVTTSISDVPDRVGGDIWPSNPQQVILSLMAPPVQGVERPKNMGLLKIRISNIISSLYSNFE